MTVPLPVRESMIAMAVMRPIAQGIGHHQWTDNDLVEIQQSLQSIHLMSDLPAAFRGERACLYACLKSMTQSFSNLPVYRQPKDIIMPYQMNSYNSIMQPTPETSEHSSCNRWNIRNRTPPLSRHPVAGVERLQQLRRLPPACAALRLQYPHRVADSVRTGGTRASPRGCGHRAT